MCIRDRDWAAWWHEPEEWVCILWQVLCQLLQQPLSRRSLQWCVSECGRLYSLWRHCQFPSASKGDDSADIVIFQFLSSYPKMLIGTNILFSYGKLGQIGSILCLNSSILSWFSYSPRLFTSPVVMNPPRCCSVSMTVFLSRLFLFACKDTTTCWE